VKTLSLHQSVSYGIQIDGTSIKTLPNRKVLVAVERLERGYVDSRKCGLSLTDPSAYFSLAAWTALSSAASGSPPWQGVNTSPPTEVNDEPYRLVNQVRAIVRRAAKNAGVADAVSPHWLRHAHTSHALDHGAPIHLVQATLGHSSVATTSNYLHVRPGDSSARFLVISEQANPAVPQEPKARQTATVAQQARRVALGGGKSGKEAVPPKKGPQSARSVARKAEAT
jgi:hypothetical protein